jgi:hypothetical protein
MTTQSEEINESQDLLKKLTNVMSTEAKSVFVGRLSELAYERHGSRDGAVLEIAVKDAEDTDLEWLEERLRDAAYDTISHLQTLIDVLISQRDMARAEVETLRGVGCMENGDGPCGVCIKCAHRGLNNGIK